MKNKHVIRSLKRYVDEHCTSNTYWALEKTFKPFFDEESGEWKIGIAKEFPVNHKRRVKKVFKKFGIHAAIAYLKIYTKNEKTDSNTRTIISN